MMMMMMMNRKHVIGGGMRMILHLFTFTFVSPFSAMLVLVWRHYSFVIIIIIIIIIIMTTARLREMATTIRTRMRTTKHV